MINSDKTGFRIPYIVRNSPAKGKGVFINASIRKGTILWCHKKGQYTVYDERSLMKVLARLSRSEIVYELEHIFSFPEFPNHVIRVHDDSVLINHSRQPTAALNNSDVGNEPQYEISSIDVDDVTEALLNNRYALIAIRDLKADEELTLDYRIGTKDPVYFETLCSQYDLEWPWL